VNTILPRGGFLVLFFLALGRVAVVCEVGDSTYFVQFKTPEGVAAHEVHVLMWIRASADLKQQP